MASKPQIIAIIVRRENYIIRQGDYIETSLRCNKRRDKNQKLYFRIHRDKQEGVRELRSYALIILCIIVLLTLYIITELILSRVLALGKRCLGPDFKPY